MGLKIPFLDKWLENKLRERDRRVADSFNMGRKIDGFKRDFITFLDEKIERGLSVARLSDEQEGLIRYAAEVQRLGDFESFNGKLDCGKRFQTIRYCANGDAKGQNGTHDCTVFFTLNWNIAENYPMQSFLEGYANGKQADDVLFRFFQTPHFRLDAIQDKHSQMTFDGRVRTDLMLAGRGLQSWYLMGDFLPQNFRGTSCFVYVSNGKINGVRDWRLSTMGGVKLS
jgi:hypothetical protein